MPEEIKQNQSDQTPTAPVAEGRKIDAPKSNRSFGDASFRPRRNTRRQSSRDARPKPEFDQKIINIRRVTRVAAGGKRFSFSVAIVIGNRHGGVGVGLGKGGDTALAIDKSISNAKRHLISVRLTKTMSIPHYVDAKYSSARVFIQPSPGRGIIAGSAVRTVIDLAGIKDVTAKLLSPTKNQLNIARAAIVALSKLPRREVSVKLGTKEEVAKEEVAKK